MRKRIYFLNRETLKKKKTPEKTNEKKKKKITKLHKVIEIIILNCVKYSKVSTPKAFAKLTTIG